MFILWALGELLFWILPGPRRYGNGWYHIGGRLSLLSLLIGALVLFFSLAHFGSRYKSVPSLPRIGIVKDYPVGTVTILDDRTTRDINYNLCIIGTVRSNSDASVNVYLNFALYDSTRRAIGRICARAHILKAYGEQHFEGSSSGIEATRAASYKYNGCGDYTGPDK